MTSTTNIGFKDWALACAALGTGRQSIILRKGGLAEGRGGFRFKHEAFFLFPTQYHEQAAKVRPEYLAVLQAACSGVPVAGHDAGGSVEINCFFRVEWARWLEDWETVARLAPFHVYREEVARERFYYDDKRGEGLQIAFGRAYSLDPVWRFPDQPSYGGCRSWVELPAAPENARFLPVLDEDQHQSRSAELERLLSTESLTPPAVHF